MQTGSSSQDSQSNDHIYNRGRQKGISQWITCRSIKQENHTVLRLSATKMNAKLQWEQRCLKLDS